jgi:hypothetical protein
MANLGTRSRISPLFSAGLLYLFHGGFGILATAAVPWLIELWDRSPRLGALAWLGLVVSPVALIGLGHHAAHAGMDRFDATKRARELRLVSLRAGVFGWAAMALSSTASALLLLALFPPPPDEETLASFLHVVTDVRLQAGVHAVLWVGVAALLYHVDQARDAT